MSDEKTTTTDQETTLINSFTKCLFQLLKICEQTVKKDGKDMTEVQRLRRLMRVCPNDILFEKCKFNIWNKRKAITTKNADDFLNTNYNNYIKGDPNQEFIRSLIRIVKNGYVKLKDSEKVIIWKIANSMLNVTAKYMKLKGDFKSTS